MKYNQWKANALSVMLIFVFYMLSAQGLKLIYVDYNLMDIIKTILSIMQNDSLYFILELSLIFIIITILLLFKANIKKLTLTQYINETLSRKIQKLNFVSKDECMFMKHFIFVYQALLVLIILCYIISNNIMILYIVQIFIIGDAYVLGNFAGMHFFKS